ncbi:MAG: LacI family transcriptional regulator [Chloroflexota bacterium]|jgi:DNA-binding LacI/PurR family transcriptional regulator|nr:LacI family transcriptional regulator [Chloroflexota bacterium]
MGTEGSGEVDPRGAEPLAKQRQSSAVPTMRDIARVAGVSQSTVSRVLNDAPTRVPIAAETRERVMVAARELGYRPNPHARSLRGASTMLIGAVVRDFSDPFFATVIEALAVEAMARGYNIVLGHAHGRVDEGIALTSVLETRHTDAIVMLGDMQDQPRLLDDLRHSAVPVVATWQGTSPLEFPTVDVDERAGIIAGLEYLIDLGHERIAFVSGLLPGDNRQRQDAFTEFISDRFGGAPDGYVQPADNSLAGGEAALRALLDLDEPPTAVMTSTDLVAVGVLHAAYSLGRTVPDELSVVGFDDLLLAAHTVPALTTLRMPIAEIVNESVELAVALARDPGLSRAPRTTVFKPTLVVRQSTGRPATARSTGIRRRNVAV